MHQYDRYFKFKINEDTWMLYLLTEEEAIELDEKVNGDDASGDPFAGMVTFEDRCLFLVESKANKGTILHELVHIYIDYMNLGSANLDVDQFEEVIAVWLENNVDKLIKMRDNIYRKYKKLEGA